MGNQEKDLLFSVAAVYVKNTKEGVSNMVLNLITKAKNKDEALGKAINRFKEITNGYTMDKYVVIKVYK